MKRFLVLLSTSAIAQAQPPGFVANAGQWAPTVRFATALAVGHALVGTDGFALLQDEPTAGWTVALRFAHSAPDVKASGEQLLGGRCSYFVGARDRWRTAVPSYAAVHWAEVWPGIDVRLRVVAGVLEYDVLLEEGADLDQVVFEVAGGTVKLDADGTLILDTPLGVVRQAPPHTFAGAELRPVACRFRHLDRQRFGFAAPDWDRAQPLVIDPGLHYATFLGGAIRDTVHALAHTAGGVIAITGPTRSFDFPITPGAFDSTVNGEDAYVALLDPKLPPTQQLLYATFLGSSGTDRPWAIGLDSAGVLTVAGECGAADFPTTTNAHDPSFGGGQSDGFVAQLDPARTGTAQLVYATFVGGGGTDVVRALVLEPNGACSVAGHSTSSDFATTPGAFARSLAGASDAFVVRLDPGLPAAQQLLWATLFGGQGTDLAYALTLAAGGRLAAAGSSTSSDLPTTASAFDQTANGGRDGWIAWLDPSLQGSAQLTYATLVGGQSSDTIFALTLDPTGAAVAGGGTQSTDFPTSAGAYDVVYDGLQDAVVLRLDPALTGSQQLTLSTYFGGSGTDTVFWVAWDGFGWITAVGGTASPDAPTTAGAFDPTHNGLSDALILRVDPWAVNQAQVRFASFAGGGDADVAFAATLDASGLLTFGGETWSSSFPVTPNAFDSTYGGMGQDAFVAQVQLATTVPVGNGCGSSRVPSLTVEPLALAMPALLTVTASANAPVILLAAPGLPAPTSFGACVVQPSVPALVALPAGATDMRGALSAGISVPNDPLLLGADLTMQVAALVVAGPWLGVAELSNGVSGRLGY